MGIAPAMGVGLDRASGGRWGLMEGVERTGTGSTMECRGGGSPARRWRRLTLAAVAAAILLLAAPSAAIAAAAPGDLLWADPVSSGDGDDVAWAVGTNAAGQPIVVGGVFTMGGGRDMQYRSYNLGGGLRWSAVPTIWDGGAGGDEGWISAVVVDKPRNCAYVAGTTESPDGDDDLVLLKVLDAGAGGGPPSGQLLWARTFDAAPGGDEEAAAIARDSDGNVYLTGRSQRGDGSWDLHLVKYDSNGNRVWARRHNNGGSRYDKGEAIAVRGTSVFVAGTSERPGRGNDIVLIRYSLNGARKWVRYYDDPLHRSEAVGGIAATRTSVYLCGYGKTAVSKPGDALLLKYGHDGSRKWVRYAAGSGRDWDYWTDVAVDNRGRVHVTGYRTTAGSGADIATRLYSSSGRRLWQRIFRTKGEDWGTALAVDSSRRTYVCGHRTLGGDKDIVVLKYGSGGATLWKYVYTHPTTDVGPDMAFDIAVAGQNVFVAGRQRVNHGGGIPTDDFLTLAIMR